MVSELQRLADKMADAWIAFARTGDPNTSKLPKWAPYTAAQRATMVLNDSSALVNDPFERARAAMQAAMKLDRTGRGIAHENLALARDVRERMAVLYRRPCG